MYRVQLPLATSFHHHSPWDSCTVPLTSSPACTAVPSHWVLCKVGESFSNRSWIMSLFCFQNLPLAFHLTSRKRPFTSGPWLPLLPFLCLLCISQLALLLFLEYGTLAFTSLPLCLIFPLPGLLFYFFNISFY